MPKCVVCSKPAGLFSNIHEECKQKRDECRRQILSVIETAIDSGNLEDLETKMKVIAESMLLPLEPTETYYLRAWEDMVDKYLEDGFLDEKEEANLNEFKSFCGISESTLNREETQRKLEMALVLRDIARGNDMSQWLKKIRIQHPFNLQKSEDLIWLFEKVPYYEGRMKRPTIKIEHMVSEGLSNAVYYRSLAFTHPVDTKEMILHDTGIVGVSTHHLYFYGESRSFRAAYEDIVAFSPFKDGLGYTKDSDEAKPQFFITGDGWFTYNLVKNIIACL